MDTALALSNGSEGRARWSLRLLGGFELRVLLDSERVASLGKRECALLAYLAVSPNCRQPRRKLAALLWGDTTDETALNSLRTSVWSVRRTLGDAEHRFIASEGEDIVLDVAAFDVDALAFRRLASQSGRVELEEAANLYSGEFLHGVGIESEEFESWRRGETARCRDQAIDVLSRLMTLLAECGETERAIEAGTRILRLEPLHEAAARRLMRLYGESGRRGAAVQLYRALAGALRTELDAKPEAETRAVFAEIAHGGEERTSGPAAADAKRPPHSTTMARASEAPGGPLQPPARPAFRLRTPLAILAGVLIVTTAFVSYWRFTLQGTPAGIAAERAAAADPASAIAIAVLPFLNLSGDASQEFFSDGMTEEITSAIAKIADLRVVGRTSAFQFKGEKKDLRAVGQALNATHLIEGSVRKAGNRVRITVQLVQAENGLQVWTENYDRELNDVFAIQEEIARAIAASLRMSLGLKPGENLVNNRSIDPESYEKFLRAKALFDGRITGTGPTGAAAIFEEVTAKNPGYAPAWGRLAGAYFLIGTAHAGNINLPIAESRERADAFRAKGEAATQRGLQADPNLARGYLESGIFAWTRAKPLEAEEFFTKALGLDPLSPDALDVYAIRLGAAGRVKDALAVVEKGRAVEPFLPALSLRYAQDLWLDGQNDAAIAQAKTLRPVDRAPTLAMMYAALGRYGEAADALMEVASDPNSAAAQAARLLRTAPAKAPSPEKLPRLPADFEFVFLHVGAPERALYTYERRAEIGFLAGGATAYVWHPSYAPVRKTERFKTLMRKAGLVEYWRAKGWPAQCHPTTGDDFACT